MRFLNRKKAQEEIVGFVLIVVLVSIIAVVFLGISLRNTNEVPIQESEELNSFISSISYLTTDCQIPEGNFKTVGNLITKCYFQEKCSDSRTVCSVLENNLKNAVGNSTYIVGKGGNIYYYEMKVYVGDNEKNTIVESASEVVEGGEIGVCKGTKIYNEKEFSTLSSELLYLKFEVCYT